jgi:hypothetical protein
MKYQPGYLCHARAEYIYGIRPSDGVRQAEDLSSGEVQAFLLEHPEVQTTPKIARHLCFIEGFRGR